MTLLFAEHFVLCTPPRFPTLTRSPPPVAQGIWARHMLDVCELGMGDDGDWVPEASCIEALDRVVRRKVESSPSDLERETQVPLERQYVPYTVAGRRLIVAFAFPPDQEIDPEFYRPSARTPQDVPGACGASDGGLLAFSREFLVTGDRLTEVSFDRHGDIVASSTTWPIACKGAPGQSWNAACFAYEPSATDGNPFSHDPCAWYYKSLPSDAPPPGRYDAAVRAWLPTLFAESKGSELSDELRDIRDACVTRCSAPVRALVWAAIGSTWAQQGFLDPGRSALAQAVELDANVQPPGPKSAVVDQLLEEVRRAAREVHFAAPE